MNCAVPGCRNQPSGVAAPINAMRVCHHQQSEGDGKEWRCVNCGAKWPYNGQPPTLRPEPGLVAVNATPAAEFEPEPRTKAMVLLCEVHRGEFEKLGWLEPPKESGEDA